MQGTPGTGTTGNDVFTNIVLAGGTTGQNNNFGELAPASLAGYVYSDANNDGIKQPVEAGIAGVTVALTGTDDRRCGGRPDDADTRRAAATSPLRCGSGMLHGRRNTTGRPPRRQGHAGHTRHVAERATTVFTNIVLAAGDRGAEQQLRRADAVVIGRLRVPSTPTTTGSKPGGRGRHCRRDRHVDGL